MILRSIYDTFTLKFYQSFWEERQERSSIFFVKSLILIEFIRFCCSDLSNVYTLLTADFMQESIEAFPDEMEFT